MLRAHMVLGVPRPQYLLRGSGELSKLVRNLDKWGYYMAPSG